jgi:DNA-binding transcriptional MerR regulator
MDLLTLSEVRRRTGLSARTLRFYETRGLLRPVRSDNGRRCYDADQLARLHRVLLLRGAGFTLAQIAILMGTRHPPMAETISVQLAALRAERDALTSKISLIEQLADAVSSDIDTLCNLIQLGSKAMQQQALNEAVGRLRVPENRAVANQAVSTMLPPGTTFQDMMERWASIARKTDAAMPHGPASRQARDVLQAFDALVAPFADLAADVTDADRAALWNDVGELPDAVSMPLNREQMEFIKAAMVARGDAPERLQA